MTTTLTFTSSDENHVVSVALARDDLFEYMERFFADLILVTTTYPVQLDVPQAQFDILDQSGTVEHVWQSCTSY